MSKTELMNSFPKEAIDRADFLLLAFMVTVILIVILSTFGYFMDEGEGARNGAAIAVLIGIIFTPICLVHMHVKHVEAVVDWEKQEYYEYVDNIPTNKYSVKGYAETDGKYTVMIGTGEEVVAESVVFDSSNPKGYVEAKYADLGGSKLEEYAGYRNIVLHLPADVR